MKFGWIFLGTSRFDETWAKGLMFAPRWHINS
jgi:hypothetical protein